MTIAKSFENALRVTDPDSDLRVEAIELYKPHVRKTLSLTLNSIEAIIAFFKDESLTVFLEKDHKCEIFAFDTISEALEDKDIAKVIEVTVLSALEKAHAKNQTP